MKIPFNKPLITGKEEQYIKDLINAGTKFSGDGTYSIQCHELIGSLTNSEKVLLTTSCTHALEMAAMLIDIQPGDEVIMPSFTFVSTANPFVIRGAKIIFVDIRPDTMNIDESLVEAAITDKTRAIVPVHYAGVGCNMDEIMKIATTHNLWVIEDAAQCVGAYYKNKHLGTIGHLGALSFHDTKNIHCGEGGCLLINDSKLLERSEIIREKGTNRSKFLRGAIDRYTWVDKGSSYLPSELNAAFLLAQLERVEEVTENRRAVRLKYETMFQDLINMEKIAIQRTTDETIQNGHIFYIKLRSIEQRQNLINHLKSDGINAVFHYIPLHDSNAGKVFGEFSGNDIFTTTESEKLLRLPLWYNLEPSIIVDSVVNFFQK